jgi:hypothetical protein
MLIILPLLMLLKRIEKREKRKLIKTKIVLVIKLPFLSLILEFK